MECQEVKEYLYLFLDGEINEQKSALVKQHLNICPLCALTFENEKQIDSLLKKNIPQEKAPYELKEEILKQVEGCDEKRISRFILPVLRPALIGITGVVLFFVLLSSINRPSTVYSETLKEHIQFLQGNLSMNIISNKPQEVSKWLQAKLDFKVMAPDLSSQGVTLQGARVCDIKGKKAAYIMYAKNEHHLSVFMFDARGLRFPKAKKIAVNDKIFYVDKEKGYNSVLWLDDGIACVFVSDIGEAELLHLASL